MTYVQSLVEGDGRLEVLLPSACFLLLFSYGTSLRVRIPSRKIVGRDQLMRRVSDLYVGSVRIDRIVIWSCCYQNVGGY